MNDAEYEAEKARVDAVVDLWLPRLGLKGYATFYCVYDREEGAARGHNEVAASMASEWHYRQATLTVHCGTTRHLAADDLNLLVVHELSHFILDPLARLIPKGRHDMLEFATECVARAICRVHTSAPVEGEY